MSELVVTKKEKDYFLVCAECGSSNISALEWRNPNTGEFVGDGPEGKKNQWCEECKKNVKFVSLKEWEEKQNESKES